jgi:uncharacterized membrane protein SpoIIM required for sporulation
MNAAWLSGLIGGGVALAACGALLWGMHLGHGWVRVVCNLIGVACGFNLAWACIWRILK